MPLWLSSSSQAAPDELDRARRNDREPDSEEYGLELRYDGEMVEETELSWVGVEQLAADEVDYDTKPDDWL